MFALGSGHGLCAQHRLAITLSVQALYWAWLKAFHIANKEAELISLKSMFSLCPVGYFLISISESSSTDCSYVVSAGECVLSRSA